MSRSLTKPRSPRPELTDAARAAYAFAHRLGRPELVTAILAQLDEAPAFGASTDLLMARALFALLGSPTTVTVEDELMHT